MEYLYPIPEFIDQKMLVALNIDDKTGDLLEKIKSSLERSSGLLRNGGHLCALSESKSFQNSQAMCENFISSNETDILKSIGILNDTENSGIKIDSEKLWGKLFDCIQRIQRADTLNAHDLIVRRFFVAMKCSVGLDRTRLAWKKIWEARRQADDCDADMGFAIVDCMGQPLPILDIALQDSNGEGYDARKILPFIGHIADQHRIDLYHRLSCTKFTENYMLHPSESSMLGEHTVIAKTPFEPGECIGIYGGTMLRPEQIADAPMPLSFSRMMSMACHEEAFPLLLDGNNIIAKINTILSYDDNAKPAKQAENGYNVRFLPFDMHLQDGRAIRLSAAFTVCAIASGTELRVNYNYSESFIEKLFS